MRNKIIMNRGYTIGAMKMNDSTQRASKLKKHRIKKIKGSNISIITVNKRKLFDLFCRNFPCPISNEIIPITQTDKAPRDTKYFSGKKSTNRNSIIIPTLIDMLPIILKVRGCIIYTLLKDLFKSFVF